MTRSVHVAEASPTESIRKPIKPVIPSASETSLGFDAALPGNVENQGAWGVGDWKDVATMWRARIAAEKLRDTETAYYRTPTTEAPQGVHVRPTDGALCRIRSPLAYTPHAWRQLINLLLQEVENKPRGAADPFRWLSPAVRALAFAEVRDRSERKEDVRKPMVFRTFLNDQGVRTLRAVLSGVHSGTHFDDSTVIDVIDALAKDGLIDATRHARFGRTVNRSTAHVTLNSNDMEGVSGAVFMRNSETACGSLEFSAALRVTAVDALIVSPYGTRTVALEIESTSDATRRRHTLPRANVSETERARIARQRIGADVRKVADGVAELRAQWADALTRFAPKWTAFANEERQSPAGVAVIVDLIEEHGTIADFRAQVEQVVARVDGLKSLPFGSAAFLAAVFGVIGQEERDYERAEIARGLSHEWLKSGFAKR